MFNPQDSTFKKFLKSPHHAWLAGLSLGVGLISANLLVMIGGAALYLLGWIYMPDMGLFQGWVKKKQEALDSERSQREVQAFIARRQALIGSLSPERLRRYMELAEVCRDIERAARETGTTGNDNTDPRLRKLDELMWTFLRLLVMEGSLKEFLETENQEKLPGEIESSKSEIAQIDSENKAAGNNGEARAARLRLLESRKERLAVLTRRQERVCEARDNVALVAAEQDRLVEQVKLLRADAIAARNAEAFSARIDATVEHLTETNKLFTEMDQFKDLVSEDLPQTNERLGFTPLANAPLPPVLSGNATREERRPAPRQPVRQ